MDLCCRLDIVSLYCMKKNALHKNRLQDIGRTLECSERLEFKMDKENFFDDESNSEDEENPIVNLSDSDVDDIEGQLKKTSWQYDSEEYHPHPQA